MTQPPTPAEAVAEWCARLPRCPLGHQAIGYPPADQHGVLRYSHCAWCEQLEADSAKLQLGAADGEAP